MIIENQEAVFMEEGEDLAAAMMGGIWSEFKASIPALQSNILTEAFNLILLSQPLSVDDPLTGTPDLDDPDFLSNRPGSLVPSLATDILVSDQMHTPEKKNAIYQLITGNIIEILSGMGFIFDEDVISQEHLPNFSKMLSFFYDMQEYEDVIGIADLMDSYDIPPKDRFLLAMEKYIGEDVDLTEYELLIVDVSEVTLKTIRNSLKDFPLDEGTPQTIIDRVLANKELLNDTLAFKHIRNNGQLGGAVESFLNFYTRELDALLETGADADQIKYGKEVIAIFLISELNTPILKDRLIKYLSGVINDHISSLKIEKIIDSLEGLQ